MHPLAPDLTKLTIEELNSKHSDLLRRITYAYRIGQPDMVQQLQMLMLDYQNELAERGRKALEEMEKTSKNFKHIIDIQ
jgi:SAM-dependent MidA family methyltransferase